MPLPGTAAPARRNRPSTSRRPSCSSPAPAGRSTRPRMAASAHPAPARQPPAGRPPRRPQPAARHRFCAPGQPNRSNTVFTGTYIRSTFNTEYFPNQFTVLPHNGDKVTVAGKELAWHALDTANFDVKLYRFAYGLNKPTYGVIFWAVTVIDSPREMKNVRLAAGSNSASMWWLNGKEAAGLFDDRRMK